MIRIARFILRAQWPILAGMLVLAGLGTWQRTRLKTSKSLQALVVQGDPRRAVFEEMERQFGDHEILAVVVDAETIYAPEVLGLIAALTGRIQALPGVVSVTSVTTLDRVDRGLWGLPVWRPLYDPRGGEANARQVRAYLEAHPFYRGKVVSRDGRTALLIVRLAPGDSEGMNQATLEIESLVGAAAGGGVRLGLAGQPLIRLELIRASQRDVDRLLLVALGVIVVILGGAFRRPVPVLLAVGVVAVGVVVATGAIAALGITMNNLLAMVPALVLIIASSTSMHLLTRYTLERRRGAGRSSAVARTLIHVGPSCFWASATTAIGFLGLIVNRVPALRQCGAMSALGVTLSFIIAMGFIPTLLSLRRRSAEPYVPVEADLTVHVEPSAATRWVARLVTGHARAILAVAGLVAGASIVGLTRLRVETDRLDYFRPTDPLRVTYRHIEQQFGGLTEIDVLVSREDQGEVLTAETIHGLAALEDALVGLDDVSGAMSVVGLIRHAHQVRSGEYALPLDPWRIEALREALSEGPGAAHLSTYVSQDGATARIVLYTPLMGSSHLRDLIDRIQEVVAAHHIPETRTVVTGSAAVFAGMVRYVVWGQTGGLLAVMGILLVIMAGLTRGLRSAFVCLLPTALPILMLYGTMAALGVPLNLHTSVVSALAAGIAIDNAIHFLSAFKREVRRTGDYAGSVERTLHIIGRALIINCLLIAGGLGAFTQAKLVAITHFGLLLSLTMVNALIMGLVLLPALMLVLRPAVGPGARASGGKR